MRYRHGTHTDNAVCIGATHVRASGAFNHHGGCDAPRRGGRRNRGFAICVLDAASMRAKPVRKQRLFSLRPPMTTNVLVFGRRDDETCRMLSWPASKKRQGTKSREVWWGAKRTRPKLTTLGELHGSACAVEIACAAMWKPAQRRGSVDKKVPDLIASLTPE